MEWVGNARHFVEDHGINLEGCPSDSRVGGGDPQNPPQCYLLSSGSVMIHLPIDASLWRFYRDPDRSARATTPLARMRWRRKVRERARSVGSPMARPGYDLCVVENIYFELTRAFNAEGPVAVLGSGQAVVYYRLTLASKDGDWILREDADACERVLNVLEERGARYRPCAPLDVRWLRYGWSSHLEFLLEGRLRVRCDFVSRPPRLSPGEVEQLFLGHPDPLLVVGLEQLVRLKRTQRAKDYPIISELARRLAPEREIELTLEADRIMELAPTVGKGSTRPCVVAARGGDLTAVELELVREIRRQREDDHRRIESYAQAARPYLARFLAEGIDRMPLRDAHARALALAERMLPRDPLATGEAHADPR